jgi:hypothetical protein
MSKLGGRKRTHGESHGVQRTTEYRAWAGMHERCLNPQHKQYKHYGGRGITVCARWKDYEAFLADMGRKPEGTSIDRINNEGNYEPGNCRWATRIEQNSNMRSTRWITCSGERRTLNGWARVLGINVGNLSRKLRGTDESKVIARLLKGSN